jgi:hypothetical protein
MQAVEKPELAAIIKQVQARLKKAIHNLLKDYFRKAHLMRQTDGFLSQKWYIAHICGDNKAGYIEYGSGFQNLVTAFRWFAVNSLLQPVKISGPPALPIERCLIVPLRFLLKAL